MNMQTPTKITGGIKEQGPHYAAVRQRLRLNPPVKNRLKEVLAAAEQRAADLADATDRLRAERVALRAEADGIDRKDKINYEMAYRQRRARRVGKNRQKFLAKHADAAQDFDNRFKFCPFKANESPVLRATITLIMNHFRVTWLELVSSVREHHLLIARAVLYNVLRDTGFTWYSISKLTGHDVDYYPARAKAFATNWREKARTNACFENAMTCVTDISPAELALWKVKKSPFLPTTEKTEKTESK
jgi:hypothetical protein